MAVIPHHYEIDIDIVKYQVRIKLAELGDEYVKLRRLDSDKADALLSKMARIRLWANSLDCPYIDTDTQFKIAYALITISGINYYPSAPVLSPATRPAILIGSGTTNNITNNYYAGVDFVNSDCDTGTENVVTFALSEGTGCVYNYTIKKTTNQRSGVIVATWLADGSGIDCSEVCSPDVGSTSDVVLSVDVSAGLVRLRATVASNDWSVTGKYFLIP